MIDETQLNSLAKMIRDRLQKDFDVVLAITGEEGISKCQPKGSKVMMDNGAWKNIEDIEIGDEVLSPQKDGTHIFSKVMETHNWLSNKNYNVVELNRKHKILYSCAFNHIIPVNFKRIKHSGKKYFPKESKWEYRNYEAQDFIKLGKTAKKDITAILTFPIETFKGMVDCEIEPYSLGVWLGDGHFSSRRNFRIDKKGSSGNWLNRDMGITSSCKEIIDEVSKYYQFFGISKKKENKAKTYRFSLRSKFVKLLEKYGLEGKGSGNKFIPKSALYSSKEYRLKLLAGLIDTDGSIVKSSQSYSITTKSRHLAEDILFIIYTLGGRGNILPIVGKIKSINFKGLYYRVSFYLGKCDIPIKVKEKIRNDKFFYKSANRIAIDVKESKPSMVYGFTLDSKSGWYITDNFMVTHNSSCAIKLGMLIDKEFDLERNIIYIPDYKQITAKVSGGLPRYSVVIIDEAVKTMYKRQWQNKAQIFLNQLYAICRKENKASILCMPNFNDFDAFFRQHRIKIWIHLLKRGYGIIFGKDWSPFARDKWWTDDNQQMIDRSRAYKKVATQSVNEQTRILRKSKNYMGEIQFNQLEHDLEERYKELNSGFRLDMPITEENTRLEMYKRMLITAITHMHDTDGITQVKIGEMLGASQRTICAFLNEYKRDSS